MDVSDIFCCLFPLVHRRKKKSTFRPPPPASAPLKKSRRARQCAGPVGFDRYRAMVLLRSRSNYGDMRRRILGGILYDPSRTLVVWCPQSVVPTDFVVTALYQYGEVERLVEDFSRSVEPHSSRRMWYGTVVEYCSAEDVARASKGMQLQCRHIRVIPMEFILSLLVDCELLYGGFNPDSSTTVALSGRRSLNHYEATDLFLDMAQFGCIQKLFIDYRRTESGVVCRVTYSHFAQAYLAAMLLHGQRCDEVLLSADIEEEEKEEIAEQARRCLMIAVETHFPH